VFSTHDAHVMALAQRLVTIEDGCLVSEEARSDMAVQLAGESSRA